MPETVGDVERQWNKVDESFAAIVNSVRQAAEGQPLDRAERDIFRGLLALGLQMLKAFVAESGTGYAPGRPVRTADGGSLTYKGIESVAYLSIFGELRLPRAAFAHPDGGTVYPMDARWNRPDCKYSYLLQEWLQGRAAGNDFREAVNHINEIFGLGLTPNVPLRLTSAMEEYVETFYEQAAPPDAETEGSHIGVMADGKGVRIVRRDRDGVEPTEQTPKARREKGDKRGTKKEAVVTAHFTFNPGPRDPELFVRMLMKQLTDKEREARRQEGRDCRREGVPLPREPLNVHVRATLEGKDDGFARVLRDVHKRDPEGRKGLVAFLDGAPSLEQALLRHLEAAGLTDRLDAVVLDIWHVAEYVWAVGTALHGEGKNARKARNEWVANKLRALLNGRVGRVIGALRQIRTKHQGRLTPVLKKALDDATTYFENHTHMMDYATYLARGYPIATGLVEGLCNSLVKDRMEQSGMRWSIKGAQAMLQQRAVKCNGDWVPFCAFRAEAERARLYPQTYEMVA